MSLPNPNSIIKKNPKAAARDGLKRLGIIKPQAPVAAPGMPDPAKQAPTIDSAEQSARQGMERLRRRRGVLANVFGGKATLG